MFVILMTTLFYKASILQGEIWCWSLLRLKGLIIQGLKKVPSFSLEQVDFLAGKVTFNPLSPKSV